MTLLIGFLGGIAAVALKGLVDLHFERRRDFRSVRAAVRLVDLEFSSTSVWLDVSIDDARWMEPDHYVFDHATWRENKALLASALTDQQWRRVSWGYRAVLSCETLYTFDQSQSGSVTPAMGDGAIELVESDRRSIDSASSVLGDVALAGLGQPARRIRVRARQVLNRWRARRRAAVAARSPDS